MNVLIACEESQRVCLAFRKKNHNAFSCDILEPSGGHPEYHILGDALKAIKPGSHSTMDGTNHDIPRWDLIIAHPPCTYLTVAGNRYFNIERYGDKAIQRHMDREKAVEFFMAFMNADCERVAVENPVGIMSTRFRKPDQIIQPYYFGDHARKATCLWLKGLPKLVPTDIVDPGEIMNGGYSVGAHADGRDNSGKWLKFTDPELSKLRSKTFPGIANAMADQWG